MNWIITKLKTNVMFIILFLIIFLTDLISKLTAYLLLEFDSEYHITKNIIFRTVLNNQESKRIINLLLNEGESAITFSLLISISMVLTGIYLILISRIKISKYIKLTSAIVMYLISSYGLTIFLSQIEFSKVTYHFSLWISILSALILFSSFFIISESKITKFFLTGIIAGGFGNFLSHCYAPFYVIDFIYIPNIFPGIFNLADFFYFISIVLLLLYFSISFVIFSTIFVKNILKKICSHNQSNADNNF